MNYKHGTLCLAFMLATSAPAFANSVSGHSKDANKYVTFSEDFLGQQDSRGNAAKCNFLSGSPNEAGSQKGSFSAASFSGLTSGESATHTLKLIDFGSSLGSSTDKDNAKDEGKRNGKDKDGGGSGAGGSTPSPLIAIPEPGSQSLLLFGLASFGLVL